MLVPLSWLKEYFSTKTNSEKIAEKLLLAGTKVEEIKKVNGEVVFDLEITPNRPDTLSILGVARELAALEGTDVSYPETNLLIPQKETSTKVNLNLVDKKLCPYYSVVKLTNVEITNSPDWMVKFLKLSNIRPINNIVDITNFVMLETGNPMHAFDSSKIKGTLTIRGAKKGETVRTLDGQLREVPDGAILIEDEEKLVDLAGLMGGKNSEIDSRTTEIILLVPIYNPVNIRLTSLYTNLRTEASNRFEKNLDPNGHQFAIERAIKLISELANGRLASKITSTPKVANPRLNFDKTKIESLLGIELKDENVIDLLSSAGFIVRNAVLSTDQLEVEIPSYRTDVKIQEDLLEEIARLHGYNNLPKTLPSTTVTEVENKLNQLSDRLRSYFLQNGFTELTGFTLVSGTDLEKFGIQPTEVLKVRNPVSRDFEYLRPNLLINLLKAIATNQSYEELSFFEIAKVFSKDVDTATNLPKQKETLGFVTTLGLAHTKGLLSELNKKFSLNFTEIPVNNSFFSKALKLEQGNRSVGYLGEMNQAILQKLGIERDKIYCLELTLEDLEVNFELSYQPLPKYPSVFEDISFFLDEAFPIGKVIGTLETLPNIKNVELLDIYRIGGKRSVTLKLEYNSEVKTLETNEIIKIRQSAKKFLTTKFSVEIRED